MMTEFLIKWLKPKDVTQIIIKAKNNQKQKDEIFWREILDENISRLKREHELELQEKDSSIAILEQHIQFYKNKENEVREKEFTAKKQIKENYAVAQGIVSRLNEYQLGVNKIFAEIEGIRDKAEIHKEKITMK